jgi:hypothetical protein
MKTFEVKVGAKVLMPSPCRMIKGHRKIVVGRVIQKITRPIILFRVHAKGTGEPVSMAGCHFAAELQPLVHNSAALKEAA